MRYSLAILAIAAAVEASPFPQGVTQSIAPSGTAPAGCQPTYAGTFGIAVMNITAGGQKAVSQAPDGQPGASTGAGAVSTIADGQPQAPTSGGGRVVSTIADGQPQAPTKTMAPINQIGDGQVQQQKTTMAPINQIGDGQIQQKPTTSAVNQISDGQIQQPKPTTSAVNQISDGQIQQPKPTTSAANQISDGQVQQPKPTTTAVGQIGDGQPQASTSGVGARPDGQPTAAPGGSGGSGGTSYVACKQSDTLQITLQNGILKDNQGRTGYIASNYQFQFDGPPQAGAIYTAGFSVCNNGSLALGGSNTFYQCLSGDFYNLYDRSWAPQCSPINIQVVELTNC